MRKKLFFKIFLMLGLAVFTFFLYKLGLDAFQLIKSNINYTYLSLFILTLLISFIPYTMRLWVILRAYGKRVPLFKLVRQTISAFAVSYVTPMVRLGGEPLRIYMLKKECGVDYKTGSTGVILDKFVEVLGSVMYGVIGLTLLLFLPGVPIYLKATFGGAVLLGFSVLFIFYKRTLNKKGSFSSLFVFLRLNKIEKWKSFTKTLKDIESKIYHSFRFHKKVLLLSLFFYCVSGVLFIIEFKFLLLSIGFNATIYQTILIINIWGLLNFVPVPASLGFLDAGQAGLFYLFEGNSAMGLAMTLILRFGNLIIVCLGFLMISKFGIRQLLTKLNKTSKQKI